MKVAATIRGSYQIGEMEYQAFAKTYIFDSSQSLDEILAATECKSISALNLSDVKEPPHAAD